MFAPILPRPTIPSCIDRSLPDVFILLSLGVLLADAGSQLAYRRVHFHTTSGKTSYVRDVKSGWPTPCAYVRSLALFPMNRRGFLSASVQARTSVNLTKRVPAGDDLTRNKTDAKV